jgi:hypothetical protein
MRRSSFLRQRQHMPAAWPASIFLALLVCAPPYALGAEQAHESTATLSASKILPPDLVAGPNHRVE